MVEVDEIDEATYLLQQENMTPKIKTTQKKEMTSKMKTTQKIKMIFLWHKLPFKGLSHTAVVFMSLCAIFLTYNRNPHVGVALYNNSAA